MTRICPPTEVIKITELVRKTLIFTGKCNILLVNSKNMSHPIQRVHIKNDEFEGISITGDIIIELIQVTDIKPTDIVERIEDTSNIKEHILIGNFGVMFNDAENSFETGFMISLEGFTARANPDVPKARMVTIICQYLFYTMEMFIRQVRPTNTKGDIFTVPHFLYSETHFEQLFPNG